jgi:hypothetical protein
MTEYLNVYRRFVLLSRIMCKVDISDEDRERRGEYGRDANGPAP